jgi:hypothetical protein
VPLLVPLDPENTTSSSLVHLSTCPLVHPPNVSELGQLPGILLHATLTLQRSPCSAPVAESECGTREGLVAASGSLSRVSRALLPSGVFLRLARRLRFAPTPSSIAAYLLWVLFGPLCVRCDLVGFANRCAGSSFLEIINGDATTCRMRNTGLKPCYGKQIVVCMPVVWETVVIHYHHAFSRVTDFAVP